MVAGLSRLARPGWRTTILVCAGCSKRMGNRGFGRGGRQSLASAMRRALGASLFRRPRAGVVEVKCLGVCPRGAITLVDAARPDTVRLVSRGADLPDLLRDLGVTV